MQTVHTLKGKEVLLLEDDLLLGKRIEAYLSNLGLETTRVENFAHAQDALQEMFFDFALFDLNLPDIGAISKLILKSVLLSPFSSCSSS